MPMANAFFKNRQKKQTLRTVRQLTILLNRYGSLLRYSSLGKKLRKLGHKPRMMAPKFVIPYRQNEKNDANDVKAICCRTT